MNLVIIFIKKSIKKHKIIKYAQNNLIKNYLIHTNYKKIYKIIRSL